MNAWLLEKRMCHEGIEHICLWQMQKLSRKAPWWSSQIERQTLNYLFINLAGGACRIPSLRDNHRNPNIHTKLTGGAEQPLSSRVLALLLITRDYFHEHLPHRWRERAMDFNMLLTQWPPESPNVTPCDFFLRRYMRDKVFVPSLPVDLSEL
ncbi:hypothetical protein TNCV_2063671 [Trichonephila clavipes]|nr:hypothetical protein TNCV_2063671 [Trichonephila clavipes]